MMGPYRPGWYRRPQDDGHIVHKVSGNGGFWITCRFDLRHGYPCDNVAVLTTETWQGFERSADSPPAPN